MTAPPATPDLGDLRRLTPIDSGFGLGRGKPVDRHYIEDFLRRHRGDIRGRVLEVGEDAYTVEYGGSRVTRSDVLHADDSNPRATLIGDLAAGDALPGDAFDCFICTQTLTYIYDVQRAVRTIHRILRPGGVLLATVPGISQMSPYDRDRWGEYWRFTAQSLGRLLGEEFGPGKVEVEAYGNVLASTAFLQGLCAGDLSTGELDHRDPRYQMLVTGRAVKADAMSTPPCDAKGLTVRPTRESRGPARKEAMNRPSSPRPAALALCATMAAMAHGADLRSPDSFASTTDQAERSRALFGEAGKVIQHPRCLNCHPAGERPTQGADLHPHNPLVVRGGDDKGAVGMRCTTCHQADNFEPSGTPGHPLWHVAPISMAWQQRSLAQICEQIKDPGRNGGKSLAQIQEHMTHDSLVGWGWRPGGTREPAPGTQAQFGALIAAWIESGAACPR